MAKRWVERREAGLAPAELADLRRWLAESEEHRAAFVTADRRRDELDWALHAGVVDEVLSGLKARTRRRSHRRRALAAVAGCALLAGGWAWTELALSPEHAPHAVSTQLAVEESTRRILPDGSIAQVRAGSKLEVNYTGEKRSIFMEAGAAHFDVVRDPNREFVVCSGGLEVRAIGTAFAVAFEEHQQIDVIVTHGVVAVERIGTAGETSRDAAGDPRVKVGVGQRLRVSPVAVAPLPQPEMLGSRELELALAWRFPHLEFAGTPLRDVVARMNRYNREQFVISDSRLAELELTGYVRADRVDALTRMLESEFPIQAKRSGDTIELQRKR